MSFTSIAFYIFMPVVFSLYWLMVSHQDGGRLQNLFVVVASYKGIVGIIKRTD